MSLEIQILSSLSLISATKRNDERFLQFECFLELFFSEIMLESWGCGLYTSAAYTRVFTVTGYNSYRISLLNNNNNNNNNNNFIYPINLRADKLFK